MTSRIAEYFRKRFPFQTTSRIFNLITLKPLFTTIRLDQLCQLKLMKLCEDAAFGPYTGNPSLEWQVYRQEGHSKSVSYVSRIQRHLQREPLWLHRLSSIPANSLGNRT